MGYRGQQMALPLTKIVKYLIVINLSCWFFLQVVLGGFIFPNLELSLYLGLVPQNIFLNFFVWQFGTYMFLHDTSNIMHIVFNMFTLWWVGSELEQLWGAKKFLTYYLFCGIGAAIIYFCGVLAYYFLSGYVVPLQIPVVGASGAIFGLLLAYGILFGEREVLFMFLFPLKAKFFILILGLIELSMLLSQGIGQGRVANLAHLGGIVAGFIYLSIWTKWKRRGNSSKNIKKGSSLKLVVNNDKSSKYWN